MNGCVIWKNTLSRGQDIVRRNENLRNQLVTSIQNVEELNLGPLAPKKNLVTASWKPAQLLSNLTPTELLVKSCLRPKIATKMTLYVLIPLRRTYCHLVQIQHNVDETGREAVKSIGN